MDRGRRRKARLTAPGFYVLPKDVAGDRVALRGEEAHHAARVCRCRRGDLIDATDGVGTLYRCRVLSCSAEATEAEILERLPEHGEARTRVTLAVAPVKGERFDWLVEKAVEAGAARILPVVTERTVIEAGGRRERWQRMALAAMKQTKRSRLTEVAEAWPFGEALADLAKEVDLLLMAWEGAETSADLSKVIPSSPVASVGVLVGPEGGFTEEEVALARPLGARPFSLGPR
ncbi:MAG: 16S rRNA (uracil(1498)-N(3))-methyltransferase, partial [Armatimonadetes bacterium]|nr:16S rRNA (uracil(1498)-N(3))-methyltransferase [Armatimonadota bacterium]